MSLERLQNDLSEWSQATFGSDLERGPVGALKHLAKEACEAAADPSAVVEYADCLILLLDAARRAGFTFDQVVDAAGRKLSNNRHRVWPKPVRDEPVEHVRSA